MPATDVVVVLLPDGSVQGFSQDGFLVEVREHGTVALCHCDRCPEAEMQGWRERLAKGELDRAG